MLKTIAEMPDADCVIAGRIHALVTANAPDLPPKTWYGLPAYAKDGKVVCFFKSRGKFKGRFAILDSRKTRGSTTALCGRRPGP